MYYTPPLQKLVTIHYCHEVIIVINLTSPHLFSPTPPPYAAFPLLNNLFYYQCLST